MTKKVQKESKETTEAVAISSFAKCQAENLRRRQELAEKINQERLAELRKQRLQRGFVAAEKAEENVEAKEEAEMQELVKEFVPEAEKAEMQETEMEMDLPAQELPMQKSANERLAASWGDAKPMTQPTAQELKEEAIRKAMRAVATMEAEEKKSKKHKKSCKKERRPMKMQSKKRVALAILCTLLVVGGIGTFVAINMPTVSYGAMAMQSGIDLSKMWVPRDFSLVTSSAGEGSLTVTYAKDDVQFVLSAEKSSWDSKTLLNNYVEMNWRSYDTVKEQGLTIYISGSKAAWVNGGVKYIIDAASGSLTNKQIKTIATSL